jgi:hypothetical protein
MKPLGIVLLFLNFFASIGVVYLATQSWGNKHAQNVAVVKHELVLSGMPTDTKAGESKTFEPAKPEETVKLHGREIRAKVLDDHFGNGKNVRGGDLAGMSATPPLSVVAEVEDMKKQFEAKVAGAAVPGVGPDAAKIQYLVGATNGARLTAGPLTLLADDFEERSAFREWLSEALRIESTPPAQRAVARLTYLLGLARSAFDAKFALAIDPPNPTTAEAFEKTKRDARAARDAAFDKYQRSSPKDGGQAKLYADYLQAQDAYWTALAAKSASLSEADRRRRAAGLLAVLDTSAAGQKRTALLVGLNDYATAVLDRTQRLSSMPERYDRQGESELASFGLIYKQRLKTSQDLDFMLQRQLDITKTFAAQEKAASDQVVTRTKHRDDSQGRVDDLDKRVKTAAAAQADLEKEIFALQQLVGARFDELFQLEDQVFKAEKQKAK